MDIKKFVEQHERKLFTRKHIYYKKSAEEKKLIIIMSAHNHGEKYMALRSFAEKNNSDLLFINNPENNWYLDSDDNYIKLLGTYLADYEPSDVTFYGSSMSGYAAILFSLHFNCNAVAINPQINLDLSMDYGWGELNENITKIEAPKIKLEKYCVNTWKDSVIYILHGHDDIDTVNIDLLQLSKPDNKKLIIQSIDIDEHENYLYKDIDLFYNLSGLLDNFRKINIDIDTDVKTTKKTRRKNRNRTVEYDPLRDLRTTSENEVLWQNRFSYEENGKFVYFSNVGLYDENGNLSGALCQFSGSEWKLISPRPSYDDNLLSSEQFIFLDNDEKLKNNEACYMNWWARCDEKSNVTINAKNGVLNVTLEDVESNNIYLSVTPKDDRVKELFERRDSYFTLSMDVISDQGNVYAQLGGYSESGYFHKNSPRSQKNKWSSLIVFDLFSNICTDHREFVFARLNIASDKINKRIKLHNLILVNGFFPMGFK